MFSGFTSRVWPALARADVFLATSTAEPLGNAVVEARLACRPVVATAVEGHLETVPPGRTGQLVAVGDAAAMAGAVRRLVDEPGLAEQFAVAAQARAQKEFSLERYPPLRPPGLARVLVKFFEFGRNGGTYPLRHSPHVQRSVSVDHV
jgi:glycosyltransferase involved in cell wall biosynthesis